MREPGSPARSTQLVDMNAITVLRANVEAMDVAIVFISLWVFVFSDVNCPHHILAIAIPNGFSGIHA